MENFCFCAVSYYLKCIYGLQILKNRFWLNIRAANTFSSVQKWMILTQVLQVVYFWHGCKKSSSRISRSSKVIHSLGHLTFGSLQITGFGGACVGGGGTLTAKRKKCKHLQKHQNLMQKIKNETQRISISAVSFFVLKLNCIIVLNQCIQI